MATYTYTNENFSDQDLLHALVREADPDGYAEFNGDVIIVSNVLSEAQADALIVKATDGSLHASKMAKIDSVKLTTATLLKVGAETWSSGDYTALSEAAIDRWYIAYLYFTSNPADLTTGYPVELLDGTYVSTTSLTDIQTLITNAKDRLIELYTQNTGTKGEVPLIADIMSAADQTALDAITDTRT